MEHKDARKPVSESAKEALRAATRPTSNEARLFLEKTRELDTLFGPYKSTLAGAIDLKTFGQVQELLSGWKSQINIRGEANKYGINAPVRYEVEESVKLYGGDLYTGALRVSKKKQMIALILEKIAEAKIKEKREEGAKRFITEPIMGLLIASFAAYRQAAVHAHENNSDKLAVKLLEDALRVGLRAGLQYIGTS